jgi:four helix bundle protein
MNMKSDKKNIVKLGESSVSFQKSRVFSRRIVKLAQYLEENKGEHIMSKQLLRSGTSIGANLAESLYSSSRADFLNKIQISLKECSETIYWLDLLYDSDYLTDEQHTSVLTDCAELLKLLVSTSNTSRINQKTNKSTDVLIGR